MFSASILYLDELVSSELYRDSHFVAVHNLLLGEYGFSFYEQFYEHGYFHLDTCRLSTIGSYLALLETRALIIVPGQACSIHWPSM